MRYGAYMAITAEDSQDVYFVENLLFSVCFTNKAENLIQNYLYN